MNLSKFQKSYFDVLGLCCSSEIPLIEKIVKPMVGVREVSVIVASRTVIVVHDNLVISQLQIVNALNQARLEANIRAYGETNYRNKWPSPFAIACGVFLLLSLLKYVYDPLKWFAIVAAVVGIGPIILKGYAALRNFTLDTNILMLIAVMGSIALQDFWEAASIVFLFTIAQWLESRASHKATAVMSSLMNMIPQKAVLAETGGEVDANEVMINTVLAVKPGENIPIDGVVVDGKCEVDEKTLTGESFPVFKKIDSIVWAGTINLNGYISVKTTALAEDCAVAKMAKLVEEAQNNKCKTQRFIDKCATFYTPAIMAISIGLAAIPAILKVHNLRHWLHLALVVLVSACPCALILSTPVATFCALSKAATSGLLIKGGEYLETLSKIKIMGFDKTGTITRGEFVVTEFQCLLDGVSLDTLLYWVSSIESKSSHPMAAALINYGRSLSIEPNPECVEEFENFPGEGILGRIAEKDIYVGNQKIAWRAGCGTVPILGSEGKSVGYIFLGGVSAGIFSLSDTCRTGAKEAINELKSMGIKISMLTGDSTEAATIAQNQLGGALEVIHAELLPQDKVNIIKEFQKQATTAMVGDGLNDAPALATADIGISMGVSGSALANDTCHVILMSNDMTKIPMALKLARKTKMKIVQNVFFSILTKAGILALAFAGYPLVWAAVLADVGTCLVVILNSMLLLKGKEARAKQSCKSSWKCCFRRRGCNDSHSHGNHSCHNHKQDHAREHEFSSKVHLLNDSEPCHGHYGCPAYIDHSKAAKNGHAKSSKHSHGHNNHNCHSHEIDHSHEHESSSDVDMLNVSETCCDHTNVSPAYVEYSKEANNVHTKISKHNHSHGNHGCHNHKHDHSQSLSDIHKHHSPKPCDGHAKSSSPRQTNECCVQKNQVKKIDHKHNHNTKCDGKQNVFYLTEAKSCETEKCLNLIHKNKHAVEIGESNSDHLPSDVHCRSTQGIAKHERNCCVHDKVADVCGNNNANTEGSLHERKKCGATKYCSSDLMNGHIARCGRSYECCKRNIGFGEKVGGLSEIVVQ